MLFVICNVFDKPFNKDFLTLWVVTKKKITWDIQKLQTSIHTSILFTSTCILVEALNAMLLNYVPKRCLHLSKFSDWNLVSLWNIFFSVIQIKKLASPFSVSAAYQRSVHKELIHFPMTLQSVNLAALFIIFFKLLTTFQGSYWGFILGYFADQKREWSYPFLTFLHFFIIFHTSPAEPMAAIDRMKSRYLFWSYF